MAEISFIQLSTVSRVGEVALSNEPALAFNCILNYVHGKLEGDQFIPVACPATFGEVANILVNQTLVYLIIKDK